MSLSITKGDVLAKWREVGLNGCHTWITSVMQQTIDRRTILSSINKVLSDFRRLDKSKSKPDFSVKMERFTKEIFVFPKPLTEQRKRKSDELENVDDSTTKAVARDLAAELNTSLRNVTKLQVENQESVKSKKENLVLKRKFRQTRKQLVLMRKDNKGLKMQIKIKAKELKRIRARNRYNYELRVAAEKKLQKISNAVQHTQEDVSIDYYKVELERVTQELAEIEESNEYMQMLLNDRQIILYDEESMVYLPCAQQCISMVWFVVSCFIIEHLFVRLVWYVVTF